MSVTVLPGEKYEVAQMAGKGGAGEVFRVYDRKLQKNWAAKKIKKNCPGMEALVLGRIKGGRFPRIVDMVEDGEFCYLIMDWIEGESLQTQLERFGAMTWEKAVEIGIALCEAIGALHAMQPPLLYLDCKPSNIMTDGEGGVWLVDFGSTLESWDAQTEPVAGSIGYAAPEQFGILTEEEPVFAQEDGAKRGRKADVRSDVFGLGRTLYALLSGMDPSKPPYAACPLRDCNPEIPRKLEKIVERCMQKSPSERFGTMEAVKGALQGFLEEHAKGGWKRKMLPWGTWLLLGAACGTAWRFYQAVLCREALLWRKLALLVGESVFALAACLWQRFVVEKRRCRRGGWQPEPLQSVLRTQKESGRWLFLLLFVGMLAGLWQKPVSAYAFGGKPQIAAAARGGENMVSKLPLVLRDAQLRKLLVKEGSVLEVGEPVYLELDPALFKQGQKLEISVRGMTQEGEVLEYRLWYRPLERKMP